MHQSDVELTDVKGVVFDKASGKKIGVVFPEYVLLFLIVALFI